MTRPVGAKISFRANEHLRNTIDQFISEEGIKTRSEFLRMVVIFFFMAKMTGFIKKGDVTKVFDQFESFEDENI